MKIEHGTYTVAHTIVSDQAYELSSKIYTNDVNDVDVTFTLQDDSVVTLKVYKGTVLPLVTKKAVWTSGTLIALR